jgi:hypothetical protein
MVDIGTNETFLPGSVPATHRVVRDCMKENTPELVLKTW